VFVRTFLITVVLAAVSSDAAAQSAVCDTVRPGDTASAVARRLTGRASSRDEPWFRVFDRSRSRVIPKARYDRLLTGWQVCVPAARAARHAPGATPRPTSVAARRLSQASTSAAGSSPLEATSSRSALALACFLLGPVAFGAAVGWGWHCVERAVAKRRAIKREMAAFWRAFVNDFEQRLLIDGVAARPIHARMRCVPRQHRLEILLAPGAGRRYPNLTDHRRNLEYDVSRITQRLRHHAFVPSPPRAEGQWVVIPFYFRPRCAASERARERAGESEGHSSSVKRGAVA
jgi:hypothetical protein